MLLGLENASCKAIWGGVGLLYVTRDPMDEPIDTSVFVAKARVSDKATNRRRRPSSVDVIYMIIKMAASQFLSRLKL